MSLCVERRHKKRGKNVQPRALFSVNDGCEKTNTSSICCVCRGWRVGGNFWQAYLFCRTRVHKMGFIAKKKKMLIYQNAKLFFSYMEAPGPNLTWQLDRSDFSFEILFICLAKQQSTVLLIALSFPWIPLLISFLYRLRGARKVKL